MDADLILGGNDLVFYSANQDRTLFFHGVFSANIPLCTYSLCIKGSMEKMGISNLAFNWFRNNYFNSRNFYVLQNPELISPYIRDSFTKDALKADGNWSGWESLIAIILVVGIGISIYFLINKKLIKQL